MGQDPQVAEAIMHQITREQAHMAEHESGVVSLHAYHAGARDAYLRVLATLGVDYTPESWTARLATIQPTGPDHNDMSDRRPRRTAIIEPGMTYSEVADLASEIAEGAA